MDTLKTDQNGLAKVNDNLWVNPLYATPQSLGQMYKIQNPTSISTASLNSANSPIQIPQNSNNTSQIAGSSVQGITEGLNTGLQGIINDENARIAEAKANTQTATNGVQTLMQKLGLRGQSQVQAETAVGIPEKTQLLTDATNEYNTKALEYRRMEEAVMKEGLLTDVQKSARLREISRVKNTELADIGIKMSVAQNNLKAAQDLVDRKIDLEYGDLKDMIGYQMKFLDMNKEDLTKAEANSLQLKIENNKRIYEEGQKIGEFAKTVATNGAPADVISRVSSAKTMQEAVQAAGRYSGDQLDRAYKLAQIQKLNADTAKVIAESAAASGIKQDSKELGIINDIQTILDDKSFDSTFGLQNTLSRNFAGTSQYALNSKINNVINQLALAARGQLKGQGQVSDFEGKMLRDAQTALKINMTPEQARIELAKVRGAIATSMGLEAPVAITAPDGTIKYGRANQQMINEAIAGGYKVEYK